MLQRKRRGKIVSFYEYGELSQVRSIVEEVEETWSFLSNNNDDLMMNYSLIQALDNLSREGWDLVCVDQRKYILRKLVRRHIPEAHG